MSVELKVPDVGESVSEVYIGAWLKSEGEHVEQDEPLVELESDKATVEAPATTSGILTEILCEAGESAAVGDVIARLEADSERDSDDSTNETTADGADSEHDTAADAEGQPAKSPSTVQADEGDIESSADPIESDEGTAQRADAAVEGADAPSAASEAEPAPMADELPADQEADADSEEPSDREFQVNVSEAYQSSVSKGDEKRDASSTRDVDTDRERSETPDQQKATDPPGIDTAGQNTKTGEADDSSNDDDTRVVPMSPIRRRIAQRLVEAQQNSALLTTFNEIDMSAAQELRTRHQQAFHDRHQARLGIMPFFVNAVAQSLRLVPELNAQVQEDNQIAYHKRVHLGIAIGSDRGLVVPVLRDADQMDFSEIEQAIDRFAQRATDGTLTPDDMQGGTFTISNGGIFGSLLSTPLVNPPQSGVLGMHAIQNRPVACSDNIAIRPMMYVAVTYDHRIVDGREAVAFLKHVKDFVEAPERLLLQC